MKAFEIYRYNLYAGIRIYTVPFCFVALGKSPNKQHIRIPIGLRDVKELVSQRPYHAMGKDPKMINLIRDVNVWIDKTNEQMGPRPLLIKPRDGAPDTRILVKWGLPSTPKGTARISANRDVFVVGKDKCVDFDMKTETFEILAILKPKQELQGIAVDMGGTRVESVLSWDGIVLRIKCGLVDRTMVVNEKAAPPLQK